MSTLVSGPGRRVALVDPPAWWAGRPFDLVGALAAAGYLLISLLRLHTFQAGMDLTIFAQASRQYATFSEPVIRLKAQAPFSILGDHFSPILASLGPLYAMWPNVRLLLLVQAVLLGLGVAILGRYAARHVPRRTAMLIQCSFALSWGMLGVARFDFHEAAFGVPLLIVALAAALERRNVVLVMAAVLLLAVKEDAALFVAGIGLMVMWQRRLRLGASIFLGAAAWLALTVTVIIPALSYYGQYTYGSVLPQEVGWLDLGGAAVSTLSSGTFVAFVAALVLVAGPGIVSPVMLVALPTVLSRVAAADDVYFRLDLHYGALLVVVAAVALIDRLGKASCPQRAPAGPRTHVWLLGLTAAAVIASLAANGIPELLLSDRQCQRCGAAREIVDAVPDGVTVAAGPTLGPHLVDRTEVSLANETWTDSTGAPLDVDWAILELTHGPDWQSARAEELKRSGFAVDHVNRSFILLHRTNPRVW